MKSVNDYFRTVLETIRYFYGELLTANFFWLLLSLPLVTIPPAIAGLYYATSQLAHNESVSREVFFVGFRKYFRVSYLWFVANVLVVGILLFNINLSVQFTEISWLQYLSGLYWVLLVVWVFLQMYTFPLLIKQDQPLLLQAVRNSAILWLKHVLFSLLLAVILIVIFVISLFAFPFWFFITASLSAYLANLGLLYLLSKEEFPPDNASSE